MNPFAGISSRMTQFVKYSAGSYHRKAQFCLYYR